MSNKLLISNNSGTDGVCNGLTKSLICVFFIVQIFTNAFALSSVLNPAFLISVILFGVGIARGDYKTTTDEPIFLSLFYLILFFSLLVFATGEKCFNHFLMWSIPPLLYFFMLKRQIVVLFVYEEFESKLLRMVFISVVLASGFALFEFIAVNFLGMDLSFIPRGSVESYTPVALDRIRARSFMEESGQFSFFLEAFVPLSIYWVNRNVASKSSRWLFYTVVVLSLFVSFSAAGFALFLIGAFIYLCYKIKNSDNISRVFIIIVQVLLVVFVAVVLIPEIYESIESIISSKLDPSNSSHSDRESRFEALSFFTGLPVLVGYGPAAFSTLNTDSFVSFYLGVLMSTGVLGSFFFFLFIVRQYVYTLRLKDKSLKITFVVSITMVVLHLAFVDNIYTPWMWVLFSLLYFAARLQPQYD